MKKITVTAMLIIVLLLIFSASGFCGNSQTIQVSCTIPEIPGINAPFLMSESKIMREEKPSYEAEKIQKNQKVQQSSPMIQEDTQKNIEKKGNSEITIKTLYPR